MRSDAVLMHSLLRYTALSVVPSMLTDKTALHVGQRRARQGDCSARCRARAMGRMHCTPALRLFTALHAALKDDVN